MTRSCAVTASFVRRSYVVSAHAGVGGRVEPSFVEVEHGEQATFEFIADPGYRVTEVSGCPGHLADGTYTTGHITADCSVTATFRMILTAPESFTAEPGDRQVALSWDPVKGAEAYDVYHAREPFDPENHSVYEGGTLTSGVTDIPHTVSFPTNGLIEDSLGTSSRMAFLRRSAGRSARSAIAF